LYIFIVFTGIAEAQTYIVRGIVRDGSTNDPLPFATISIVDTQHGVVSDENGIFQIPLHPGVCSLRCSFVGYKTEIVQLTVGETNLPLTIKLLTTDVVLQNVTVYASAAEELSTSPEVSALTLQSEKISHTSSAMPDVLRSIQMLPGVSANNEFSAKFNVRGGNQDENLVLVNGTQVYDPFHLKEAPNASIGIFNVDLIKKIDMITGGFPARYGDKLSSVLNMEYREGSKDRIKGSAGLSLTNVDGLIEGPLWENGSFILGVRKSYLEYALKMVDYGSSVKPSFYDVQGVLSTSLSSNDKIMLKFIHAGDDFTEKPDPEYFGPYNFTTNQFRNKITHVTNLQVNAHDNAAQYYSSLIALQNIHIYSPSLVMKAELSLYDQRDTEHYISSTDFQQDLRTDTLFFYHYSNNWLRDNALKIKTIEGSLQSDIQVVSGYAVKTGVRYQNIRYDQDLTQYGLITEKNNYIDYPNITINSRNENQVDQVFSDIHTTSHKASGFIENAIQITNAFLVNLGGRVDYFELNRQTLWSPRFSLSYKLTPILTLRGGWGRYSQFPITSQLASSAASDTNTKAQRAVHYITGIEYNAITDPEAQTLLTIKLEGYYKKYDDVIHATMSSRGDVSYSRRNDATGFARGIDLYTMLSVPGFYGWISYGLCEAKEKLNGSDAEISRYTDQRHTLAFVGDVLLGKGWSFNARFTYGSGYAYTPSIAVYDKSREQWEWRVSETNSAHLPAYSRLDVRASKQFEWFGVPVDFYLDVNNLLNTKNIMGYSYRINNNGDPYIEEVKLWPILPTFGMSVKF
jgi:hypothetical protein